jgi:predicted DNA-binding transcriptional regulator YafY
VIVWLIAPPSSGLFLRPRYRSNRAVSARYLCFTADVLSPTSRLLELLELLQTRPLTTGREIADRLGIDRRTVRRYVAALQGLGIPVEGARGVGGGYRIRPGFRLPPLMLSDDEAVAVVFGLVAAQRMGLGAAEEAVDGALGKVHRVLPEPLRRRVEALEATLVFTWRADAGAPVATDAALLLAGAIRRRGRVTARYRSFDGVESERELSPHGLVVHSGRWYLAAHDHGRGALRTFRVDRMSRVADAAGPALPAPEGFDAVEHVSRSLARVPWPYEVEVLLRLSLEDATRRLPPTLAELSEEDEGTVLRLRASSLDWAAGLLAGLGCEFTIRRPDELRERVRALADRLAASATR